MTAINTLRNLKSNKQVTDAIIKEAKSAGIPFWFVKAEDNQGWQHDVRAGLEACSIFDLINDV